MQQLHRRPTVSLPLCSSSPCNNSSSLQSPPAAAASRPPPALLSTPSRSSSLQAHPHLQPRRPCPSPCIHCPTALQASHNGRAPASTARRQPLSLPRFATLLGSERKSVNERTWDAVAAAAWWQEGDILDAAVASTCESGRGSGRSSFP